METFLSKWQTRVNIHITVRDAFLYTMYTVFCMLSTINVPLLVTRIQNKPLSKWLSLTHPISYQIYLSSIISNNCADTFKSDCKNVLVNREGAPRKTLQEYETNFGQFWCRSWGWEWVWSYVNNSISHRCGHRHSHRVGP